MFGTFPAARLALLGLETFCSFKIAALARFLLLASFAGLPQACVLHGGLLGQGETCVGLTPQQFRLRGEDVILELTADQAEELPEALI